MSKAIGIIRQLIPDIMIILGKYRTRIVFFFIGLAALAWFLARVVAKPSRAAYPCMQVAFPLASAFVIHLMAFTGSWLSYRGVKNALRQHRYFSAIVLLLAALLTFSTSLFIPLRETSGNPTSPAFHPPNEPIGEAVGIYPGRVVWVWNRFATDNECANYVDRNGILDDNDDAWFQDKNTNPLLVTQMISKGIRELTGKETDQEAWEAVFMFHNHSRGKGETGYQEGEKILLKLNRTSTNISTNLDVNTMRRNDRYDRTLLAETSPQIVLAVLRQLVNHAGVPQGAIYVGDPMRNHYQEEHETWVAEFPDVNYLGTNIYHTHVNIKGNGRTPVSISDEPLIFYSDQGSIMTNAVEDHLYSIFEEIEYLINLPMLKGHELGGLTVFPKNHYGSQARVTAAHLHGGLAKNREGYGKYRVLVDIMGSEHMGKKNLVYILDALYAGPDWGDQPVRFRMPPFNDDWTSSVFFSFDPVAIESVAFDFLRTEFNGQNPYTKKAWPNIPGCDDYLHQAACEAKWPAGIEYRPDKNGQKIGSLGVHEHWNNPVDKQYSRNLGTGNGIELLPILIESNDEQVNVGHAPSQSNMTGITVYPNPVRNKLTVASPILITGAVEIIIHDMSGNLLHKETIESKSTLQVEIQLNHLAPGSYILTLRHAASKASAVILKL